MHDEALMPVNVLKQTMRSASEFRWKKKIAKQNKQVNDGAETWNLLAPFIRLCNLFCKIWQKKQNQEKKRKTCVRHRIESIKMAFLWQANSIQWYEGIEIDTEQTAVYECIFLLPPRICWLG